MLLLPSIFLARPLALIASVFMLPFGIDLASLAIWLDIAVEATPVGLRTCHVITLPAHEKYNSNKLRHSAIYDDPRTVPQITEWITNLT